MTAIGPVQHRPLPVQLRSAPPPTGHQPGPAERELLRDADKTSFRVKVAVIDRVNRIDDHHPKLWNKIARLIQLVRPVDKSQAQPRNVGQVAPGLLRGEQPTAEGMHWLKEQGVRTVIDLTEGKSYDKAWGAAAGLRTVHLPQHAFDAPTLDQARAFLREATNPVNQPVYFHCYHGSDRTGTMAAVYRIAVQGWTAEQAIAELGEYGFNTPYEMAKLQFIRDFAATWRGRANELLITGR